MLQKLLTFFLSRRARSALNEVQRLEVKTKFISPFFLGETAYQIRLIQHQKELSAARKRLAHLLPYLKD